MLTPKQETFAQEVASGKNQSDAYRAAFNVKASSKPSSVNVSASQLMADPKVAQRVAELRKPAADKAQITLEGHLRDLMTLRNLAVKEKQIGAAITAEVARGKASGVSAETGGFGGGGVVVLILGGKEINPAKLGWISAD